MTPVKSLFSQITVSYSKMKLLLYNKKKKNKSPLTIIMKINHQTLSQQSRRQ